MARRQLMLETPSSWEKKKYEKLINVHRILIVGGERGNLNPV